MMAIGSRPGQPLDRHACDRTEKGSQGAQAELGKETARLGVSGGGIGLGTNLHITVLHSRTTQAMVQSCHADAPARARDASVGRSYGHAALT
jgi:hypothetical protein